MIHSVEIIVGKEVDESTSSDKNSSKSYLK